MPSARPLLSAIAACAALLLECGGQASPPPQVAPAPEPAASPAPAPDPAPVSSGAGGHLPSTCITSSSDLCTPPPAFTERLCGKPHQEVALSLFGGRFPFTRLYLKSKLDELSFDEEVLALRFHQQPKGGMVVGSGLGTYDVLRWDGSCSLGVEAEVLTRAKPPRPRSAHVQWHRIGQPMQDALIAASDAVKRAHTRRGRECKGAMSGDVSASCEKADSALVDAIVDWVRSGGDLPEAEAP